jgi:glutathione synthase/RimK-type ligase-like ATP-grasp enzyme
VRRICFVTCRTWPEISESDRLAQRALEARSATVEERARNDPDAGWDGFDAIVLRSSLDYHFEPEAFPGWLDRLERTGARVFNPPALVRWNLTKTYLLELARAGVPTVATVILAHETRAGLESVMAARGWRRVVMKPVISASAHDTRLVSAATMDGAAAALAAGAIRRPVLIQPFVEEIQTRGEWSLVFIETELTHAVLKRPAAGEFRVQPRLGGTVETPEPPEGVRAGARAALAALPVPSLYARIDGVETAAGFQIMEVEVNEPGLFFPHAPAAAARFAGALLRRL